MIISRNHLLAKASGNFFKNCRTYHLKFRTNEIVNSVRKSSDLTNEIVNSVGKSSENEIFQGTNPWPRYNYTGSLRPCYPLSTKRRVPAHVTRPDYAGHPGGYPLGEMAVSKCDPIKILSEEEIECMRVVCRLTRECLDVGLGAVATGVTTDYIDEILHEAALERNCYPSPLNYYNFPKTCCTSVNEVICHGIPDERRLQNGDIINLDVSCYYNGFHGDASETVFVGEVDQESKSLVQTTYNCLMKAINEVKPGVRYRDLGKFIEHEASSNGYSVVKTYCGHGINELFHTNPSVPHHADNRASGIMEPGHVFTIEPMINQGVHEGETWPDGWTVVTADGKRSAQFEHTVLVTETGVDILTTRDHDRPHFMCQMSGNVL